MSTTTQEKDKGNQHGSDLTPEQIEARRGLGLSPDAPDEMVRAAEGNVAEAGDEQGNIEEASVLDWVLGPTEPLEFDCRTWIDTEKGRQLLIFHLIQIDDTAIERLEKEHSEVTLMGRTVDRPMLNAAKVAEATLYLEDADGKQTDPHARDFRGPVPSLADAYRGRFKFQPGILGMVAQEIDAMAGMTGDRVEGAKRAPGKKAASPQDQSIAAAMGN